MSRCQDSAVLLILMTAGLILLAGLIDNLNYVRTYSEVLTDTAKITDIDYRQSHSIHNRSVHHDVKFEGTVTGKWHIESQIIYQNVKHGDIITIKYQEVYRQNRFDASDKKLQDYVLIAIITEKGKLVKIIDELK